MHFHNMSASGYSVPDLIQFLNEGFENYSVPIQFNTAAFLTMLRKDGIDLTASRVLIVNDRPCGIALIARRGWVSRLAAMGIAKNTRGIGAGSWFMNELIRDACQRGDRELVLEVIEQNEPAVRLYQKYGFETMRRLIGFVRKQAEEGERTELEEIDLRQMGQLVSQHGLPDLPWQLSGESIAQMNPPARAYRYEQAFVAISNPAVEHVVIWSLLVESGARGRGLGSEMLMRVMATQTGKTWHMPALLPEECGQTFERAGFERQDLSQWQMILKL
jgi:ribosomal protein S18 acetylase RimI-like enzyme